MLLSDYIKQLQKIQKAQRKKIEIGVWLYDSGTQFLIKEMRTRIETIDGKKVVTIDPN